MNCEHCRCKCGGIIAQYNSMKGFECEKCGREYFLINLKYDWIAINKQTGWMFPMLEKEDTKC